MATWTVNEDFRSFPTFALQMYLERPCLEQKMDMALSSDPSIELLVDSAAGPVSYLNLWPGKTSSILQVSLTIQHWLVKNFLVKKTQVATEA